MGTHNAAIMTVLLLVIGAKLIGDGDQRPRLTARHPAWVSGEQPAGDAGCSARSVR